MTTGHRDEKQIVIVEEEESFFWCESVSCEIVVYMMHRRDFCDTWIKWIKGCLQLPTIFILVTEVRHEFNAHKGLRQDDPLAPFLFLLVAKGLSGLVREAKEKDLLSGVEAGRVSLKSVTIIVF